MVKQKTLDSERFGEFIKNYKMVSATPFVHNPALKMAQRTVEYEHKEDSDDKITMDIVVLFKQNDSRKELPHYKLYAVFRTIMYTDSIQLQQVCCE